MSNQNISDDQTCQASEEPILVADSGAAMKNSENVINRSAATDPTKNLENAKVEQQSIPCSEGTTDNSNIADEKCSANDVPCSEIARQMIEVDETLIADDGSGSSAAEGDCSAAEGGCSEAIDIQLSETLSFRVKQRKFSHKQILEKAKMFMRHFKAHQQELQMNKIEGDRVDRQLNCEGFKQACEFYFAQDVDGNTFLHLAIALKDVEFAQWLLDDLAPHPGLLDIQNKRTLTALHQAVLASEPQLVRRLLLAGANVRRYTRCRSSALHIACFRDELECVEALTEPFAPAELAYHAGRSSNIFVADLNCRDYRGRTCLLIAAYRDNKPIVKQLIKSGACTEEYHTHKDRRVLMWLLKKHRRIEPFSSYGSLWTLEIAARFDLSMFHELRQFDKSTPDSDDEIDSDDGDDDDGNEDDGDDDDGDDDDGNDNEGNDNEDNDGSDEEVPAVPRRYVDGVSMKRSTPAGMFI